MMTWWISSLIERRSGHLSLTFELIILLPASTQHHHHYVVRGHLGEEEGEEEGNIVMAMKQIMVHKMIEVSSL